MRRFCGIFFVGAAVLCLCVFLLKNQGEAKTRSVQPEYIFTYAENQPEDYPTTQAAKYFGDLLKEETDGRIWITLYSGGALGTEDQVIDQLRYGGIDFARISVMSLAEEIPYLNVLQLPYLYRDADHMWRVLDGAIGEECMAGLSSSGLEGLAWYDAGARHIYNSKYPVERLEDMNGLRLRTAPSALMKNMVKALGAQPVSMEYSDVYAALETGEIDGAENNLPSYDTMKHYEYAPYLTLTSHNRIPELHLMSSETWKKLSKNDQDLVKKCAKKAALYERELWAEKEKDLLETLKQKGCHVTILNNQEQRRFHAMAATVYKYYYKEYSDLLERIEGE